jgi:insulysin
VDSTILNDVMPRSVRMYADVFSGETDVANIKTISKEELLSFYDKHIHPSSPHRCVLSIHLKSQIESKVPDFAQQLADGVRIFIANEGYDIPPAEVAEAVNGDVNSLPQNLYALILQHGYDKDRVAASMAKGKEMFEAQITMNGDSDGVATPISKVLKEVMVEDIKKFRSTLRVGDKPAPVQPLETFYECESPRL